MNLSGSGHVTIIILWWKILYWNDTDKSAIEIYCTLDQYGLFHLRSRATFVPTNQYTNSIRIDQTTYNVQAIQTEWLSPSVEATTRFDRESRVHLIDDTPGRDTINIQYT